MKTAIKGSKWSNTERELMPDQLDIISGGGFARIWDPPNRPNPTEPWKDLEAELHKWGTSIVNTVKDAGKAIVHFFGSIF